MHLSLRLWQLVQGVKQGILAPPVATAVLRCVCDLTVFLSYDPQDVDDELPRHFCLSGFLGVSMGQQKCMLGSVPGT